MTETRIRVATYNVHKCRGLDRRTSPERVAKVIAQLDADVVAIQEILDVRDGRAEFDQARRIAGELEGYEWCFGENRSLHGGRYGNMMLSRLPIQSYHNYDLRWNRREPRGCLRTDIAVGNGAVLHIFNLHLGTGFMERRQQARLLLSDKILGQAALCHSRIVLGDFNEWTRGLASQMMREVFQEVEPRAFLRYAKTYPGALPFLHLDHVYFDKEIRLTGAHVHRTRAALVASDHLPIVANFTVKN